MNRTLVVLTALSVGLSTTMFTGTASAQAAAAPATAPAPVKPEAIPAKIGLIAFQPAVMATNEGQRTLADVQKKYDPLKTKLIAEGTEIDNLRKQLQAAPATMSDADKAKMAADIDVKEKQAQLDQESYQNSGTADMQAAYGKIAEKFEPVMQKWAKDNGFTLILDIGTQQTSNVVWAADGMEISQAVVDAYNAQSGIAPSAPAPAPAAARRPPTTPSSGSTAPRTTPKPATTPATK